MPYSQCDTKEIAEEIHEQCQHGASISDLIFILEEWKKDLEHHKDITIGLWATDRPDLIIDKEGIMFQIDFRKSKWE